MGSRGTRNAFLSVTLASLGAFGVLELRSLVSPGLTTADSGTGLFKITAESNF
jgi:hypothetical protein